LASSASRPLLGKAILALLALEESAAQVKKLAFHLNPTIFPLILWWKYLNLPDPHADRARLGELPKDREIAVFCRSAVRAYNASRILMQNGFKVKNISGGMLSRSILITNSKGV